MGVDRTTLAAIAALLRSLPPASAQWVIERAGYVAPPLRRPVKRAAGSSAPGFRNKIPLRPEILKAIPAAIAAAGSKVEFAARADVSRATLEGTILRGQSREDTIDKITRAVEAMAASGAITLGGERARRRARPASVQPELAPAEDYEDIARETCSLITEGLI